MKHLKLGGACAVIAALIAMAVAASAQANLRSSNPTDLPIAPAVLTPPSLDPLINAEVVAVARSGIPIPRAQEAIEVQSAVERNDLVGKLEAALGEAFGGVWYVPAAAQLDVGVTSPDAAQIAEAVAVRAGLGPYVTEIPVRSSEAELVEAQERLDSRLADLLGRAEATTRASVEDNSVYMELGSEVSASERAALEGEASQAPVEVGVSVASRPKLQLALQAQCRKFEPSKAFCDPTIVGGTSLEAKEPKEPICTVGPVMAQPKGSTELYVLTAGHCVAKVGDSFFSLNKEGTKTEEIGKAAALLTPLAGEADVAAIKIENKFWKKEGEIPVLPAIAEWSGAKETEPFKVKGEIVPLKGAATCISGQTSGFKCGVIKETKVTIEKIKELVEVEKIKTLGGDSGAPWFSEKEKLVQGTHVGEIKATGIPVFEALQWSIKQFKEISKLELELLTEGNQKRM